MFEPLPARFDFPAAEKRILAFWDEHDIFGQSLKLREGAERFVFYEGPPTANGMPHPGHCLTRVMKDILPRYKTMRGFLVERKGGWDTHGLPVEREVCKELGIRTKQEIEAYGVEKFNLKCIQSVFRYTREWEEMTRRLAYWVDLKNAYVTYHQSYVESVWWSLKTLFDRGVLYQGHKVVWWWAQGGTALSSGEVGEGYRTVDDPSVFVKFPLVEAVEPGVLKAKDDPELNEQLVELMASLKSGFTGDVTIDFINAKFVTSASLGRLLDLKKLVTGGGHKLRLRGMNESLRKLFAAVALDKVFEIEPAGRAGESKGGTGVPPVSSRARATIGPELIIRHRYLPHWEAGGSSYLVTFRTLQGDLTPDECSLVLRSVTHFDEKRYLLHAAVVMPDHVHMLLTPLEKEPKHWWSLAELLHSVKSFTAHEITKARGTQSLWMEEYFDRIIRSKEDFDEKVNYILTNPDKRGLGPDYPWVWFEDTHASKQRGGTEKGGTGAGGTGVSPVDDASPPLKNGRDARTTPTPPPKTSLLVWTTTPWTLVSNHFAAVHPDLEYALVHDPVDDEHLYVAAALVEAIGKKAKRELRVVSTCKGTELIGLRYSPPFDVYSQGHVSDPAWGGIRPIPPVETMDPDRDNWFPLEIANRELKDGRFAPIGWRVLAADFVTIESGTGLVHEAPAFGEVDFDLLQEERKRFVKFDAIPLLCAVAPDGSFNDDAPERYRGRWVKECDKEITRELRDERKTPWGTPLLYHQEQYRHDYPFCPQAPDDPLIQYARKSWFVRTSQFKDEFLKNNAAINWLPEHIKEGRFGDFLRNNVDWALSRERYWGTPLPIWRCEACGKMEAIGSIAELQGKPGATDGGYWDRKVAEHKGEEFPSHLRVHKPYIDEWTYECAACPGSADVPSARAGSAGVSPAGGRDVRTPHTGDNRARMRRVPEVIDCWWDAGSMPFAQWGFPHADGSIDRFVERFPADFISEAIDQTRGWFYGLLAIGTLLFGGRSKQELAELDPEVLNMFEGVAQEFENKIKRGETTQSRIRELFGQFDPQKIYATYPIPFKTCIVLGHIAGEDGNKMSKKLRNYKEPSYIFDTLGADAMRWYFLSAQAPWTSTRFAEAAIRDSQREFLVKLYNVLSFFTIYASIDAFDPSQVGDIHFAAGDDPRAPAKNANPMGWRPTAQRTELDRWIVTELRSTVAFVRESMDRFENYPAAQKLNDFVDALSNWYVRRSRDRFWRPLGSADVSSARAGSADVPSASAGPGTIQSERTGRPHSPRVPITDALTTRKRWKLPHWEAGGSTYFLTFRIREGELSSAERDLVLAACRHWDEQRILLHAAVVMPDHVHLLCTPLEQTPGAWWSIAELLQGIKGFTAKEINKLRETSGSVWQAEYYDRIIRNEPDFAEKWNYIVTNPERRGLPADYPWIWVEPAGLSPTQPGSAGVSPAGGRDVRDSNTGGRDVRTPHGADGTSALPQSDQEKWDAYHTLYGCLRVLSHLTAPFTPFFAENMHQILRMPDDPISIHLCDYPTPEDIRFHDDALAATMDTVRELVALGRSARTVAKLKVRQPLALVELILARPEQTDAIRDHAALVTEELNVKRVELVADADKYVTYKVVPNFKAIGAKFRELVPKLKDALGKLPDAAAARRTLLDTGSLPLAIDGQTVNLTPEEVEIRLDAKPGWSAAQGKAGVVVLSTEITPELRDEGVIRELIHFVQAARKERNLPYEARIVLKLDGPPEFVAIVRKFEDVIKSECLVSRIEFGQSSEGAWQTLDIEGFAVKMAIAGG